MLRPSEFLSLALQPDDASLRRFVSTSYHALFPTVLTTAAERFVGAGTTRLRGYAIVYRTFNHGQMRQVCEGLTSSKLSTALNQQLGRASAHPDIRDFAVAFTDLQFRRQQADYDPAALITAQEAKTALDLADRGIQAFERAPEDERTDVLALMLGGGHR